MHSMQHYCDNMYLMMTDNFLIDSSTKYLGSERTRVSGMSTESSPTSERALMLNLRFNGPLACDLGTVPRCEAFASIHSVL